MSVAGAPGGGLLLAYHAYARGDPANRQLLIAPLAFDAEGWPVVGAAAHPRREAPRRCGSTSRARGWARAGSGRWGCAGRVRVAAAL